MAVAQTKAAHAMQENPGDLTSHQVISLLMAGALERVGQARNAINAKNTEDKEILFAKIVAIINGLRASLNLEQGGEIAENLQALYNYMITRFDDIASDEELAVLDETERLITEVKSGWDEMDLSAVAQQQQLAG